VNAAVRADGKEGGGGLGGWSRYIVTTCILPRNFYRLAVTKPLQGWNKTKGPKAEILKI
jgi:hypothetical protein